ncbi:MAG: peptide ABC transporter substrate-binding protein [Synergistaceae bacterium]|jgi:oligopeptide transport system substrate-binding protein|nr:peptide ABC transporter substrate-binding protein [Synergistaceae bacterium]
MNRRILVFLSVVFIACFASSAFAAPKVINYSNGNAPPVFEPIMNRYLKTSYLVNNLFTGLARISKDGVSELAYAESYKVSDDGLTYTFKIRKDAKFSDGSPLTAHDWENSFKHKISPETASPGVDLFLFVKGARDYNQNKGRAEDVAIKASDDATLEITFENPTPFFMDLICYYLPYKLDVVKANPEWFKKPETYIGNGPFRVKKFDPQVGFTMEKNPSYYDAANIKIDEVNFNFIDDSGVALEAYRNGELNVNDDVNAEGIKSYTGTEELKVFPRIGTNYLTIHTGNVPDARVRKAMALAIDRSVLVKDILGQPYLPAEGLVPYGIHWGGKEYRDVVGPLVKTDIEAAKKLLADAGYPDGKGLPTYRVITMNGQEDSDAAQAWQAMWKQIGVNTEITTHESSVYWDIFDTNNWDLGRDGWTGDYDDPMTNLWLWQAYREGPEKDARWYDTPNSRKYDELISAASAESDKEKRYNLFKEAETVILDDMPIIPVWHGVEPILVKPGVTGIVKSNIGHIYFNFADIE